MQDPPIPEDGTCDAEDCDEPAPWDMAALIFGDTWLCSPDCARASLDAMDETPEHITLHDPQFGVSSEMRPPNVGDSVVDMTREVTDAADAGRAIDEMEQMFPGPFRVSA